MGNILKQRAKIILLILIILTGAFFRFYNLNWGSPFYFHPDERNIASSISQLQFPTQMNPHFFAYGSFPIYAVYFTGVTVNFISFLINEQFHAITRVSFEQAIIISRLYSAFFSTILIPLWFVIVRGLLRFPYSIGKDGNDNVGLVVAFLAATSVGMIQYSHFGTFEIWLTFFSLFLFLAAIKLLHKDSVKFVIVNAIVFGILISIKISSLALFPVPILGILLGQLKNRHKYSYQIFRNMVFAYLNVLIFIVISFLVYIATNPYVLIDTKSFLDTIKYESSVALGTLPVFYTGGFSQTTPILFQLAKVYPFLINPLITLISIPSLFFIIYQSFKKKNSLYFLLYTFFFIVFFSQGFFFAKWTRYIVPTLPFVYLIVSIALGDLLDRFGKNKVSSLPVGKAGIKYYVLSIVIIVSFIFSVSYFITVFVREDSRIAVVEFARENIPTSARILSEVYDLGIVPFNPHFSYIKLFNFYDLEFSPSKRTELSMLLNESDYIVLPSQRILRSRLLNSSKFPEGNKFYRNLILGKLGFEKIYETPCDIFCRITYLGDPVFRLEETTSVFDRPTVFIFKKVQNPKY